MEVSNVASKKRLASSGGGKIDIVVGLRQTLHEVRPHRIVGGIIDGKCRARPTFILEQ